MKSDCLSFEFLDALSPLIHTLIPTAWASDTCRDQKTGSKIHRIRRQNGSTGSKIPGSHNIARIQDPRSKGSQSKTISFILQKSWTLAPVCPLYPSIYYQKTLQEAQKIHTVHQKRLFKSNCHLSQLIFSEQIWDPQDPTFLKTRSKIHRIPQKVVWT